MKNWNNTLRMSCFCVVSLSVVVALFPGTVRGQGFMVKPMKMEYAPRAGTKVKKVLELRNTLENVTRSLDLRLVELSQGTKGAWRIIEPGSGVDTSKLPSCLKWIKLSANKVDVKPLAMESVTVEVNIPASARGYYMAGIIAQTRPKANAKGINVVVRFLIPVLVDIQGRPVRQKIELSDIGMVYKEATAKAVPTTLVNLGISNKGRTYSRIQGQVKLEYLSKERWRPVSRAEYKKMGIMPGVVLSLDSDIKKRLPSGKYRLSAFLYVDGRRIKPLNKEVEFKGDPKVTSLATDTALVLEPTQVDLKCVPGSTRTTVIKVENASEDTVTIQAGAALPPSLAGVALGKLKGVELSCAPWLRVSPAKFTLRGGRKQNVRLIVRMPKDKASYSNYYGLLGLKASYPDGQSAGTTTSLVTVTNSKVEAKPAARIDNITLAGGEGSAYIIQIRGANLGSVHFLPKCRVALLDVRGQAVTQSILNGEPGIMLPLATRSFSSEMDFKDVKVGVYQLQASLDFASGEAATHRIRVRVAVEDGKKTVTVVTPEKKQASK
ncbi:MAG: hypothetical protein HN350_17120 [Phycisphaerales bacterium]|jgi:hypothetical protein|nr:hypothetical protein [Phycisphaerales bacterium]